MTPTELYKLQIENTELEAKLSNLRLKNEIALLENSGGTSNREEFDFAQAVEQSKARQDQDREVEALKREIAEATKSDAKAFRALTRDLTSGQIDVLLQFSQVMRDTGIDSFTFAAL